MMSSSATAASSSVEPNGSAQVAEMAQAIGAAVAAAIAASDTSLLAHGSELYGHEESGVAWVPQPGDSWLWDLDGLKVSHSSAARMHAASISQRNPYALSRCGRVFMQPSTCHRGAQSAFMHALQVPTPTISNSEISKYDAVIYDIDMFGTSVDQIATYHAAGKKVCCSLLSIKTQSNGLPYHIPCAQLICFRKAYTCLFTWLHGLATVLALLSDSVRSTSLTCF